MCCPNEKSKEKFIGTLETEVTPEITMTCISPDARDLLDRIMKAWEEHKIQLPDEVTMGNETWNPRESIYGFAYWLTRWSGLVKPNGEKS